VINAGNVSGILKLRCGFVPPDGTNMSIYVSTLRPQATLVIEKNSGETLYEYRANRSLKKLRIDLERCGGGWVVSHVSSDGNLVEPFTVIDTNEGLQAGNIHTVLQEEEYFNASLSGTINIKLSRYWLPGKSHALHFAELRPGCTIRFFDGTLTDKFYEYVVRGGTELNVRFNVRKVENGTESQWRMVDIGRRHDGISKSIKYFNSIASPYTLDLSKSELFVITPEIEAGSYIALEPTNMIPGLKFTVIFKRVLSISTAYTILQFKNIETFSPVKTYKFGGEGLAAEEIGNGIVVVRKPVKYPSNITSITDGYFGTAKDVRITNTYETMDNLMFNCVCGDDYFFVGKAL
jgi:hypothetical protein